MLRPPNRGPALLDAPVCLDWRPPVPRLVAALLQEQQSRLRVCPSRMVWAESAHVSKLGWSCTCADKPRRPESLLVLSISTSSHTLRR